jgi:HK97 family phage portal protein
MRIFGFEVARKKAQTLSAVNSSGGWFGLIRESFAGAWQRNIEVDAPREVLAFSAVFACVTIIAADIGKLRIKLVDEDDKGIATEVKTASPFLPVLAKPNRYQTRIKFIECWVTSKLLYGNTFALKQRDGRGLVTALYVLDAQRVTPLVADDGSVYYKLAADHLSQLDEAITVPASEIIHDRMVCLWHPLVGVSPIYACGMSATMGNRIQGNSTKFFDNMSRPSGALSAPGTISDETAGRIKKAWEENYGGANFGRLAVLGDGLKYEAMTIPAGEAQLIEQLKWTVEDVARCFHVPLFKLGGPEPVRVSVESLNQTYYSDCLQTLIESVEACLDDGLALPGGYRTEFDLEGLMRMDTATRYDTKSKAIQGGWMSPNEARATENMPPVAGGESPYLQQQNYSLAALAKRDAKADPFAGAAPKPELTSAQGAPPMPVPVPAPAAANDKADSIDAAVLAELFIKGLELEPA